MNLEVANTGCFGGGPSIFVVAVFVFMFIGVLGMGHNALLRKTRLDSVDELRLQRKGTDAR